MSCSNKINSMDNVHIIYLWMITLYCHCPEFHLCPQIDVTVFGVFLGSFKD